MREDRRPASPYHAPETDRDDLNIEDGGTREPDVTARLASTGLRFLHAVVDTALWVVTFAMLKRWLIFTLLVQGIDPNPVVTVLYGMPLLTLALEMFLYYQFFEGFFGRTPAKFLTQTKVVLADGGRLTFTAALKRTLLRFVPFEALSFVASLTGWHDRGSGTRVINC